ncbi:MAG: histone deacetylase [Desulfurivibrio sp.]|nr:histone deacetylase [Desulfurivibrio sp.]
MLIIDHPDFDLHDTGGGEHPETPARLTAIRRQLANSPLAGRLQSHPPRPAERTSLTAIHSESYLLRLEEAALAGRAFLDHPDNQLCYDSYQTALLAAGSGLAAIDLLEEGAGQGAFALLRPPGHHAERAMSLGFCFLNNVAVAARYWQSRHRRRKIMIIDWDAHHGNGIQAAFEEEPDIFYLSIHEHPTWSFPGTGWAADHGSGAGHGATLNLPLPPGSGDHEVRRLLTEVVEPALAAFQPEALLLAAGFDGHRDDEMSGLSYSTELYHLLGQRAAAWAARYCPGRLLALLEGGYHPPTLALSVENYLAGQLEPPRATDHNQ